jgi:hypothetical protein
MDLAGFGRATRPGAERDGLFRLTKSQNGALRPPPPSAHWSFAATYLHPLVKNPENKNFTPSRDQTQAPNDDSVEKPILQQRLARLLKNVYSVHGGKIPVLGENPRANKALLLKERRKDRVF